MKFGFTSSQMIMVKSFHTYVHVQNGSNESDFFCEAHQVFFMDDVE